jgi:hypothetical protein
MYKVVRVRDSTCRCEWTWRSNSALTIERPIPIPISADKRLHQSPRDRSRVALVLDRPSSIKREVTILRTRIFKGNDSSSLLIEDLSPSTNHSANKL